MANRLAHRSLLMLLAASSLLGVACKTTGGARGGSKDPDMLVGLVLDPEGKPIPFAKVSVLPLSAGETVERGRGSTPAEPPPEGSRGARLPPGRVDLRLPGIGALVGAP